MQTTAQAEEKICTFSSNTTLLRLLIKPIIWKHLNHPSKDAFASDVEFLEAYEVLFLSQIAQFTLHQQLEERGALHKEVVNNPLLLDKILADLAQVTNTLRDVIEFRLKEAREKNILEPRLIRLAKKMNFTDKETLAFIFIMAQQVGISM